MSRNLPSLVMFLVYPELGKSLAMVTGRVTSSAHSAKQLSKRDMLSWIQCLSRGIGFAKLCFGTMFGQTQQKGGVPLHRTKGKGPEPSTDRRHRVAVYQTPDFLLPPESLPAAAANHPPPPPPAAGVGAGAGAAAACCGAVAPLEVGTKCAGTATCVLGGGDFAPAPAT